MGKADNGRYMQQV